MSTAATPIATWIHPSVVIGCLSCLLLALSPAANGQQTQPAKPRAERTKPAPPRTSPPRPSPGAAEAPLEAAPTAATRPEELIAAPVFEPADRTNAYFLDSGDVVRVTCRHDVHKRQDGEHGVPKRPRYVLWGEGTTDEMCLGLLQVTRG